MGTTKRRDSTVQGDQGSYGIVGGWVRYDNALNNFGRCGGFNSPVFNMARENGKHVRVYDLDYDQDTTIFKFSKVFVSGQHTTRLLNGIELMYRPATKLEIFLYA